MNDILYVTYFLTVLIMVGFPLGLGIFLTRRFHLGWRLWLIGAAGFILSQVGHIPFNNLFFGYLRKVLWAPGWESLIYATLLGLSAGVFEEVTRYLVLRFWAKDARSWRKSVLLGAGHGGIEAIILGVLMLLTYINMVILRTTPDLTTLVSADQLPAAQKAMEAFWSASWAASLLPAVERILTMTLHICWSVMVMQVFTRGGLGWLAGAIAYHALVDGLLTYLAPFLANYTWGNYASEGILLVFALLGLWVIFALRQPEPIETVEAGPQPPAAPQFQPSEVKETPDNLDDTRYNG